MHVCDLTPNKSTQLNNGKLEHILWRCFHTVASLQPYKFTRAPCRYYWVEFR